ncbi:MAG: class I SAM-dependent DNA methyltransferase [Rhizobiales bacterium]|nr:class I SAM-dependent DNA methyltransferase [Hyphomicrobiales bacterium]
MGRAASAAARKIHGRPHQFLGIEKNPRAAAIAELVLWIGYLRWHLKTKGEQPPEPILREFKNIEHRDAVLKHDGVDSKGNYVRPRPPEWPESEYIVGNPPFIGGKDVRAQLGDFDAQALWKAHPQMNDSADFVMYWWDHAAELLTRKDTPLRRFGLVTTNSITQVFQRRTLERHLSAKAPVSIIYAIADHPWTKVTSDSAAVRIAMTVAEAGKWGGKLLDVVAEDGLDSDEPRIAFREGAGAINSDLTIGVDVTQAKGLKSNVGMCSPGMKLHGSGFIVTPSEAEHLGLGKREDLEKHIRLYRNGRDLTGTSRDSMVIDLFGIEANDVRQRFPEIYQHLSQTVKTQREEQARTSSTNDAKAYAKNWWVFGKPRQELRPALTGLSRYIATVETAKHRIFQFLDAEILPDNMLVCIASDSAADLGILSCRFHVTWALRAGGWLGMGNDPRYSKSRCFDPFPFPAATDKQRSEIARIAEALDKHRKDVQARHSGITLTGMYNVLEKVKAGEELDADGKLIFDDALILILKELHEELDAAVAAAYGWPADLPEDEVLARLVAMNKERAAEEARGFVRWLRPEYQIPRFGSETERKQLDLGQPEERAAVAGKVAKPSFPSDPVDSGCRRPRGPRPAR